MGQLTKEFVAGIIGNLSVGNRPNLTAWEIEQLARTWLAAHAPVSEIVPTGWKIVPVEPTPAMRKAGIEAIISGGGYKFIRAWEAALAAAPQTGAPK